MILLHHHLISVLPVRVVVRAMASSSVQTLLQLSIIIRPGEAQSLHAQTPDLQNKSHRSSHSGGVHERGAHQPGDGESAGTSSWLLFCSTNDRLSLMPPLSLSSLATGGRQTDTPSCLPSVWYFIDFNFVETLLFWKPNPSNHHSNHCTYPSNHLATNLHSDQPAASSHPD